MSSTQSFYLAPIKLPCVPGVNKLRVEMVEDKWLFTAKQLSCLLERWLEKVLTRADFHFQSSDRFYQGIETCWRGGGGSLELELPGVRGKQQQSCLEDGRRLRGRGGVIISHQSPEEVGASLSRHHSSSSVLGGPICQTVVVLAQLMERGFSEERNGLVAALLPANHTTHPAEPRVSKMHCSSCWHNCNSRRSCVTHGMDQNKMAHSF